MSVSFVACATDTTSSCALPSFTPGNVAIVVARGFTGSVPSLPASGWTNIGSQSSTSGGWRWGYRILQSGDTTTGTWTNAGTVLVAVYSGANGIYPFSGYGYEAGSGTTYTAPAIPSSSGVTAVSIVGTNTTGVGISTGFPFTNYTERTTGNGYFKMADSTTSVAGGSGTLDATGDWIGISIGLRDTNFPIVADTDTTSGLVTSNSSAWTLTYPTNIASGDLLIAVLTQDGGSAANGSWPNGWVSGFLPSGTAMVMNVAVKRADGTETGTFGYIPYLGDSEQGAWIIWRIVGDYGGTVAGGSNLGFQLDQAFRSELADNGTSNTPNPLSLNPSQWDAEDTLWIVAAGADASRTFSAYPSSPDTFTHTGTIAGGNSGTSLAWARLEKNASSVDPGTFTISNSDEWVAITIAIRPAAPAGNFGKAQAQAKIKATIRSYAQAQTRIRRTERGYAQSQTTIRLTVRGYSQSQARIIASSYVYAQALGHIKSINNSSYAQTQAQIRQTYIGFAQANSHIARTERDYAQAQATIISTFAGFAQAQGQVKQTYIVYAQALTQIRQTYLSYAQASTLIRITSLSFAQTSAQVKTTYRSYAQAQAQIKQTYRGFAQARTHVVETGLTRYATAQARIGSEYLIYLQDTFSRSTSDWGVSDSGHAWSSYYGAGPVANGTGELGTGEAAAIDNNGAWKDYFEIRAQFKWEQDPGGISYLTELDIGVATDSRIYLRCNASGKISVDMQSPGTFPDSPYTFDYTKTYNLRAMLRDRSQAPANNKDWIRFKVWPTDVDEPGWLVDRESEGELTSLGLTDGTGWIYIYNWYNAGTVQIDNLYITEPLLQAFAQARAKILKSAGYAQARTHILQTFTKSGHIKALVAGQSPIIYMSDTFSRSVSPGWGTADTGQTWLTFDSDGHSVTGGYAQIDSSLNNSTSEYTWVTGRNVTVMLKFKTSSNPDNLGSDQWALYLDIQEPEWNWNAEIDIRQNREVWVNQTVYGSNTLAVASWDSSKWYNLKFTMYAFTPDLLGRDLPYNTQVAKVKLWEDGTPEPDWHSVGVYSSQYGWAPSSPQNSIYIATSVTTSLWESDPIIYFDNYVIQSYIDTQRFAQAQAQIESAVSPMGYGQALGQIGTLTALYSRIDEASIDDNDYIVAPYGTTYAEVSLDSLPTPEFDIDHFIRVRALYASNAGSTSLTVKLYEGTTQIAEFTPTLTTSFQTFSYELSGAEIASITDYSNLRLRFYSTERTIVSWAEFQTPFGSGSYTRRAYAQAQAQILAAYTTYNVYGQAQASILRTEQAYAQALGHIIVTSIYVYAQAQSQIRATYQGYAQAQSQIKQTYQGLGQSQGLIRQTYYGYAQALGLVRQTYQKYGQALAQIKQTYQGYAQALAWIGIAANMAYAQAQAQIRSTYFGYAQAQAQVKRTEQSYGQTLAWIKVTGNNGYAQAQAQIRQTYQGYGQAQAFISVTDIEGLGQAQALIRQTYQAYGQALAQIKATYQGYGQAQGHIRATYQAYAQAQANIVTTYQSYAQALAQIRQTYQVYGQALAQIKQTYYGYGQSIASIRQTYYGFANAQAAIRGAAFANAQATIKATSYVFANAQGYMLGSYFAYAQTQATIKSTAYQYANAQASILGAYQVQGQAAASIKQTYQAYGQALAVIRQTYQSYGQALAQIRQSYQAFANAQAAIRGAAFAQAQALIRATYQAYGNAQALIRQTYQAFANTQAIIRQTYQGFGQATVAVITTYQGYGQSLGQIKQTYQQFANAQAQVRQTYLVYGQALAIILQTYYGYGQSLATIAASSDQVAQAMAYIYIPQFVRPISDISNDGWEGTVI